MSAVEARRFEEQRWDALADEIIGRQTRLNGYLRDRSPTPLEGLRHALRRKRRKATLRSFVLETELEWPEAQRANPAVAEKLLRAASPQRIRKRAIALSWRAALLLVASALVLQLVKPSVNEVVARTILSFLLSGAVARIDEAVRCSQARPVLDSDDVLVAISPVHACDVRPLLTAPVSARAAAEMHLAWRANEGEYRVAPSTLLGLSLKGWGRAIVQKINIFSSHQTGGSSPIETAVKNLLDRPGRTGVFQKLVNGYNTIAYTAQHLPNSARDRFVTESIPCVRGEKNAAFGHSLAGDLCPIFLFGKHADELDWAERCIWAGSAQPLFRVTGPTTPTDKVADAEKAIRRIKDRAIDCLDKLSTELGWSAHERSRYGGKVEAFEFRHTAADAESSTAIPRMVRSMPGLAYTFRDELKLAKPKAEEHAIRLNVSAAEQRRAYSLVMAAAGRLESRLASELCLTQCEEGQVSADLSVVLAEIQGDRLAIQLAFANRHFLISGAIGQDETGYHRLPTTRSVGSTNKAWLVPMLVSKGYDALCNEVPVGLARAKINVDKEPPCANGKGIIDLRLATAKSENGAFADGAHKLGREALETYFAQLGFDFDRRLTQIGFIDGLVLGNKVTAAPDTLMRNLAALYRSRLGEAPVSSRPSMIVSAGAPSDLFDWDQARLSSEDLRRAVDILGAPVVHQSGTLRSLGPILRRHGCGEAIGKTGTSETTVADGVRDKIVIAAFQCGSHRYVAYGMIGSPSLGMPLGDVRASDVVELIDAMLTARYEQGGSS